MPKECVAILDKDYDEEYRVSEEVKQEIYSYFLTKSVNNICAKIYEETKELRTNILQWFVSGDCTEEVQYKINDIRLFYSGDLRFLNQF